MTAFALLPLMWVVVVACVLAYQVNKLRAKGMMGGQAMEAAVRAAAVQRQPAAKPSEAILTIFGIIGAVCIAASLLAFSSTTAFIREAARGPGQIIDFARHRNSKGSDTFSPIVRFQAPSGEIVTFRSRVSSNYSAWPRQGSMVEVYYDPRNPHRARLNHFMELWFTPGFLFIFGAVFLAISIAASRSRRPPAGQNVPPSVPPPASAGYDIPTIIR